MPKASGSDSQSCGRPCAASTGAIELDSAPGKGTRVRIVLEQASVRETVPA